jgi:lysophospholipase L1-like esterase
MCVHAFIPSWKSRLFSTLKEHVGRWLRVPVATACVVALGGAAAAGGAKNGNMHWVATWATAPATFLTYVPPVPPVFPPGAPTNFAPATIQPDLGFPFPTANTLGAVDQTIRSIVKPDLWGETMRFRFSNVFGSQPVIFNSVTVGLQEYSGNIVRGTMTPVTFSGRAQVTLPVGQEVWSDPVTLRFVKSPSDIAVQGRNLAVSYSILGSSGPMTYHASANQTSFITPTGSGDHTRDYDVFAYEFTTTSWFFIDAVDVMAPAGTHVVCAFGDSITDGAHTTLNINDRWSNVLSRRLHDQYGDKVSVVNEAISGNRVVNPVIPNSIAGPAAVDRLDRDVLGLSGLTDVVWLEGINDLAAGHPVADVEGGYQNIVERLHAAGVRVAGATMTSALGLVNPDEGWYPGYPAGPHNGPAVDADRQVLNTYIRTSGLYDAVVDFDAATLDPSTNNMKAEYVPNSLFTQLPWDYLHPNHAGYTAMGMSIDIRPLATPAPRRARGNACAPLQQRNARPATTCGPAIQHQVPGAKASGSSSAPKFNSNDPAT